MRLRLSLAVGAVIVVTLLLFSVVVVRDTRLVLIDQLDTQLRDFSKLAGKTSKKNGESGQPTASQGGYGPMTAPYATYMSEYVQLNSSQETDSTPVPGPSTYPPSYTEDTPTDDPGPPLSDDVSRYVFHLDGTLANSRPAGYGDETDAMPVLPEIPSSELTAMIGKIVTLPSSDGGDDMRVLVERNGDVYTFTAASLDSVNDTVSSLIRFMAIGGGAAVILALGASSILIRRGLRPVDTMVATATAIAAGDLSQRVPDTNPRTELGKLGGALNEMLSQIEQAVRVRTESEERLRRFVADAAHELRTPLTSLRGYAELYRQGAFPTTDGVNRAMGRIESEGARMARLVEEMLLLARLDQHRPLERKPVELSLLAEDAVADFKVANPEREITPHIESDLVVLGDSLRLRQVLDNLLVNTRAHTPSGTKVEVTLRRAGDRIELTVADDGPGMSADEREHIFERFWRGDPARSRNSGGSGLGLSIVASLLEAQHGTIDVKTAPGEGSTFIVTLPIPKPADLAPPPVDDENEDEDVAPRRAAD